MLSNQRLTRLMTGWIGEAWKTNLGELKALEPLVDDAAFCSSWRDVKHANKRDFAQFAHGISTSA